MKWFSVGAFVSKLKHWFLLNWFINSINIPAKVNPRPSGVNHVRKRFKQNPKSAFYFSTFKVMENIVLLSEKMVSAMSIEQTFRKFGHILNINILFELKNVTKSLKNRFFYFRKKREKKNFQNVNNIRGSIQWPNQRSQRQCCITRSDSNWIGWQQKANKLYESCVHLSAYWIHICEN